MNEEEKSVRSVDRALNIMDCFTREHPRLSLNEISKMLNLSPSTVSRIIATLENRNYLRRDPQSLLYSLGYRLTNLGAICLETSDLREIARPHLVELRDYYNESVGLYVLNKGQRVCADCVQSTQSLRRVIEVGTQKPLTRGASGKLLLAYMEEKFEAAVNEAKAAGLDITYEILGIRPCSGDVDKERQARLLERAKAAVETVTGICPGVGSGSTDCNIPLSMGIPSVCVGCYSGAGAHTREEYVEEASLPLGYRVAFEMIFGGRS